MPEAARANTPEGATEFAKWYIEEGSQASVDWDTSALRQYAAPSCTVCAGVVETVNQWKEQGYRNLQARYQFNSSQVGQGAEAGSFVVELLGQDAASTVVDVDGKVVQEQPAEESLLRVTLTTGEPWLVQQVQGIKR